MKEKKKKEKRKKKKEKKENKRKKKEKKKKKRTLGGLAIIFRYCIGKGSSLFIARISPLLPSGPFELFPSPFVLEKKE